MLSTVERKNRLKCMKFELQSSYGIVCGLIDSWWIQAWAFHLTWIWRFEASVVKFAPNFRCYVMFKWKAPNKHTTNYSTLRPTNKFHTLYYNQLITSSINIFLVWRSWSLVGFNPYLSALAQNLGFARLLESPFAYILWLTTSTHWGSE